VSAKRLAAFALLAIVAATGSRILLADEPQAVGTWASAGPVGTPLPNGVSVAMPDGRVLLVGGTTADATPTDGVTMYDAATDSMTTAGLLLRPRTGHTATLLKDGRVLVTGGTTDGLLSADVELFDPSSGTSTLMAMLAEPRTGHVASRLLDGTVLIAGGATAGGVVLQSAWLFDPATNNLSPIPGGLQIARVDAAATSLIDGRVLVTGGNNGTADLASAEVYDPYSQAFAIAATQLSAARHGHSATLLPNNASVLIIGGTSNGVPQAGADLFQPEVFPDPFFYGEGHFVPTGAMTVPRSGALAGTTSVEGYAFAAGGGSADSEMYRFATIKTDKDDYAPGERAVITGAGWQPNETVSLLFQEDPAVHEDYALTVTADSQGNIYWDQWAPEQHDLNVRFYLMASDSRSKAQTTFTDGMKVKVQRVSPPSATLHVAGGSTTPVTFTIDNDNNGSDQSAGLTVAYTLTASDVSVSGGALTGTVTLPNNTSSVLLSWNVIAPAGPASGTVSLAATVTSTCSPASACSSSDAYTVQVAGPSDTTAPVITPSITGTLGTNDWYTSDVNLSWTVIDPQSTVTSTTGCDASIVAADTSGVTFTCSATSTGGTSSGSVTIKRDASAPNSPVATKTPAANGADWNNTAVTVSFADAGDNGPSGIASCTSDAVLSDETAGTNVNGTCADNAGNVSSSSTVQVKIDMTAPDISASRTPLANAAGWNNTDVTATYTASDALSGPASTTGTHTFVSEGAGQSHTFTVTDLAGNSASATVSGVNIDKTVPAISTSQLPVANDNGWNNTDVTASYTASDALSQLESPAAGSHTFVSEGQQSHSFTVTDLAGNSNSATVTVKIDKTAPDISASRTPLANAAGWNNTDVFANYTASDALSGLDSPAPASHTFGSEGAGQSHTFTVIDLAGNSASAAITDVNVDKTAPTVGVTGVGNGAVYTLGAVPAAGCSTVDSLSGVANAAALGITGGVPPGVGIFTAICSGGTDKAGNVAPNTSASYTVQFAPEATQCNGAPGRQVLQPINFTGSSVFPKKGGSTVPAKFRVCGVDGASIGPQQVVKNFVLYQIFNGTVAEAVIETPVESTNNDVAFRWSASDAQWIFNMSTKTLTAGKTYVYRIYLLDESFIEFQFGIK
jgi:hypothetical protein